MKIIHTYASYDVIWKERLYVQLLSALYAKKHYGNIHLYTTDKEAKQIEEIGIPYTSINTSLFKNEDVTIYSIPKLLTYVNQTEPYLHIDCDSVFYDKVDFSIYLDKKSPVVFSHPDMKHFANLKGKLGDHIPAFLNNRDSNITDRNYYWIQYVYLKLYQDLLHVQDENVKKYFDFNSIPNMSLVLVKDPELFAQAVNLSLEHYRQNKEVIDTRDMGPCYVEQLMIHEYLLSISEQYRKSVNKKDIFFFKDVPLSITLKVQDRFKPSIEGSEFPFKFRVNDWCQCCGDGKGLKKLSIESIDDIKKYLGYKFNGYTHFSFMQWYQIWQVLIIDEIVNTFGEDYIIRAHNYFRRIHPALGLPVFSESELLYEKLSGNKLFSGKVA